MKRSLKKKGGEPGPKRGTFFFPTVCSLRLMILAVLSISAFNLGSSKICRELSTN